MSMAPFLAMIIGPLLLGTYLRILVKGMSLDMGYSTTPSLGVTAAMIAHAAVFALGDHNNLHSP
jgi:hypothetical protein